MVRAHDDDEWDADPAFGHASISVSNESREVPDSNSTLPDWMWVLTASNPWGLECISQQSQPRPIRSVTLVGMSSPAMRHG